MDKLAEEINAFVRCYPPPEIAADAMLSAEDFRRLGYKPRALFPVVDQAIIQKTEAQIGFALPPLLKRIYMEVSNGISGFAYELMGLDGGCASDSGTLVEAYLGFMSLDEYETGPWQAGLLPFCDWGCATYSCVDCFDSDYRVFTYEDCGARPEQYSLSEFFKQWLEGKVHFSEDNVEVLTKEFINPFTGQPKSVSLKKRRKPEP